MNPSPMLTGRAVQSMLHAAGIDAQRVTRKRRSGHYVASFSHPDFARDVAPANEWARRLQQTFPGRVEIVRSQDMIATWRADKPTIAATVIFRFRG